MATEIEVKFRRAAHRAAAVVYAGAVETKNEALIENAARELESAALHLGVAIGEQEKPAEVASAPPPKKPRAQRQPRAPKIANADADALARIGMLPGVTNGANDGVTTERTVDE